MIRGELADVPGTEWRAEDPDPHPATSTNEENEKGGWGLPGGSIWEGGDVTQVPQKAMAGDPLRFIVCEWLSPLSSWPPSENCGDLPCRCQGQVSSAASMGSLVILMDRGGGQGSPKLPLAPAMDLYYREAG